MSPPASERAEPIVPDVGVAPTLRPSYGARTAQRAVPTASRHSPAIFLPGTRQILSLNSLRMTLTRRYDQAISSQMRGKPKRGECGIALGSRVG